MTNGLSPTESYDGRIVVRLLEDTGEAEIIHCSSYEEAIEVIKENQYSVTVAKIIDRDDEVVFSSEDMEIDVWESVWRKQKKQLSASTDKYECPYDNVSCFRDDLCVQCKMDKQQNQVWYEM